MRLCNGDSQEFGASDGASVKVAARVNWARTIAAGRALRGRSDALEGAKACDSKGCGRI